MPRTVCNEALWEEVYQDAVDRGASNPYAYAMAVYESRGGTLTKGGSCSVLKRKSLRAQSSRRRARR